MHADPEVREHLGEPLTREQSDAVLLRWGVGDFWTRMAAW